MRFSIRTIMLATTVVALVLMIFNRLFMLQAQNLALVNGQAEIAMLEQQLVQAESRRTVPQAGLDQQKMIDTVMSQLADGFSKLQAKYSSLEPRGENELAIRSIPTMVDVETKRKINRTALIVPNSRSIYLCLGVRVHVQGMKEPTQDIESFVRESIYSLSGPYQFKLPPGVGKLEWTFSNMPDSKQMEVYYNDQILIRSSYYEKSNSYGSMATSFDRPQYFELGKSLPTIVDLDIHDLSNQGQASGFYGGYRLSVWLDDQSRGFDPFPMNDKEQP